MTKFFPVFGWVIGSLGGWSSTKHLVKSKFLLLIMSFTALPAIVAFITSLLGYPLAGAGNTAHAG